MVDTKGVTSSEDVIHRMTSGETLGDILDEMEVGAMAVHIAVKTNDLVVHMIEANHLHEALVGKITESDSMIKIADAIKYAIDLVIADMANEVSKPH